MANGRSNKATRIAAAELVPQLGAWSTAGGPLFRRLAGALRRLMDSGELAPGLRLPAERHLAETLGVSRTTVVNAYGLLRQDGLLDSRQGDGTWVTESQSTSPLPIIPSAAPSGAVVSRLTDGVTAIHDLTIATPAAHPLVAEALDATSATVVRHHRRGTYAPAGLEELRNAIAERFGHLGVPTTPEQVLVTTGASQSLWLALTACTGLGNRVAVEDPTSPVILNILRHRDAHPVPVVSDAHGLRPESLTQFGQRTRPRVIIVTPTYLNPTSGVLPPARRDQLARYALEHGTVVVEDLATADLHLTDQPPPPIAAYAPEAPILSIGSASKLFWWGLRVGWIRGPAPLLRRLTQLKALVDLGTPLVAQAQAAWLIPRSEQVTADRRAELSSRLQRLEDALGSRFPEWAWRTPRGGLTLWVRLPAGASGEVLAQHALREGVAFLSGRAFSVHERHEDYVRLPFVLPEEDLVAAVASLERAWNHQEGSAEGKRNGHGAAEPPETPYKNRAYGEIYS